MVIWKKNIKNRWPVFVLLSSEIDQGVKILFTITKQKEREIKIRNTHIPIIYWHIYLCYKQITLKPNNHSFWLHKEEDCLDLIKIILWIFSKWAAQCRKHIFMADWCRLLTRCLEIVDPNIMEHLCKFWPFLMYDGIYWEILFYNNWLVLPM